MSVKSLDLKDGQPVSDARINPARIAIGIAGIAFGIPIWCVGAIATLRGWILGLNLLLAYIGLPVSIPQPSEWWALLFIPVGLIYSLIEVKYRPWRGKPIAHIILTFLFIVVTDLATTFLSVTTPAQDSWPITRWIAATVWAACVYTIGLTFIPEIMIAGGLRSVFRR